MWGRARIAFEQANVRNAFRPQNYHELYQALL